MDSVIKKSFSVAFNHITIKCFEKLICIELIIISFCIVGKFQNDDGNSRRGLVFLNCCYNKPLAQH